VTRTEKGRYRLGLRLFVMGASVTHSHALYEAALSELSEVRIATGDSAHLAVLVDTEVVHLERLRSEHLLKSRIGARSRPPVHASSTGKALLAHAPVEICERVIERGLHRYTSRTVTDPDEFRAELASVRLRGYALDREEFLQGISSVAVPIIAKDHDTMAAIAVVSRSDRLVGLHMRDTLRVLQDAASRIARRNT
jgi:DNA-binding IclR family transcriptional regulator